MNGRGKDWFVCCFCTKYPEIIDDNSQRYARRTLMGLTELMRSVHALPSTWQRHQCRLPKQLCVQEG